MRKILILMAFVIGASVHAWAANFSDPIDGIFRGVFGNSITVEVPSLVSKSPTADANQNGDLSFQMTPGTAYNNFNQVTDLKDGDLVRVAYYEGTAKTKAMIAAAVTKLGPSVAITPSTVASVNTARFPAQNVTTTTTTTTGVE